MMAGDTVGLFPPMISLDHSNHVLRDQQRAGALLHEALLCIAQEYTASR